MTQMVEASTEFKKGGYDDAQSAQLAQIASLYQNIADSELTAGESASFIISQMKAFNVDAKDAISIIDQVNEVSNNYAVSSTDLSLALTKTSSAMSALGNTSQETIGLVTAGTEIMTGQAGKVSKGLRTIGNNIANLAQKQKTLDISVNGITKSISLLDEKTGDIKSTFDVLKDIYTNGWNEMTNAEKQSLAISLANKTQFEVFTSVLSNFDNAIKSTNTALESSGSAMKENEAYMESLKAKVNALKAEFEKLILGDGGLTNFVKLVIDSGTGILKFTNSDIGQLIIKIGALTIAFGLLNKTAKYTVITLIPKLKTLIMGFVDAITLAKNGTIGFGMALKALNLDPTVLAITTIITAIYGLSKAFDYFNETYDESVTKLKELKQSSNDAENEVKTLEEELNKIKKEIININSEQLDITDSEQTEELKEQEKSLERQLALAKQKLAIENQETEKQAKKTLNKEFTSEYVSDESSYTGLAQVTSSEELKAVTDAYNRLKERKTFLEEEDNIGNTKEIQSIEKYMDKAKEKGNELATNILEATSSIDGLVGTTNEVDEEEQNLINTNNSLIDSWNEVTNASEDSSEENVENSDSQNDLVQNVEEANESLKEYAKELGISTNELLENAEALGLNVDSYYEYASAMKNINENVDNIQSAYGTLKSAVDEYNSSNGFTVDTIQELLELDPEYLTLLELENGQLVLNEEAIKNKVIAQAEEAKQTIYNTAIERLNAISSGEAGESSKNAGEDHRNAVDGIDAETDALGKNTMANVLNKASKTIDEDKSKRQDVVKIIRETTAQIKAIDSAVANLGSNFANSMGKAKSSSKGANSALKQQQSIVKSLKSQYKSAFDKIIHGIDSQIKALRRAKDEALRSIDAQIKALEKEKDKRERYWDNRINALKKENTERERSISLQEKEEQLALAKQNKTMLYTGKGETGFEYSQDENAVNKAEQDLFDEKQKISYEEQLEKLEELKQREMDSYDSRIEALRDYREQVADEYDRQIELLEEQKEKVKEEYDKQVALLEEFKDKSNVVWEDIVSNLNASIAKYNASLANIQVPSFDSNGFPTNVSKTKGNIPTVPISTNRTNRQTIPRRFYGKTGNNLIARASGDNYVDRDSLSIVGDNPNNREIVLGDRLNNDGSVVMALKRGSGVVNNSATETVAGMLNSLSNGLNGSTNGVLNNTNNSNSNVTTLSIQNVNVKADNANEFIESMKQFSMNIRQDSYNR